ncbi:aldolase/citrate lyase family protein [Micromonospora sp. NBC_01699]|uniref:HpcH/HpaI aldolase family protein n=1 Tax=Micromonospora sp. NBC_01699 TaxID=2975984 RepID=UPI002E2D0413|nr:aldolase/citrate lyase family protein [Micromonospora sp. NBC_01699]
MTTPDPNATRPTARAFVDRLRRRDRALGYWVVLDSPVSTERIARLGYDYVCVDAQHGLVEYAGILRGLTAIDAGGGSVGLVRVGANDPYHIGQALDAGAAGVIVPLVDSVDDAVAAVASATYPPHGVRSYGPMRSALRVGPLPAEANASVACLAMIETAAGLANVERICTVPGLTGVYVGPSDLCLAVGGAYPGDPEVTDVFEAALARIRRAAADAGVAAGIHTAGGHDAANRLAEGFTFATVSSDLVHLERAAADHLRAAGIGGPV